jgi:hypothetical protein
MYIFLAAQWGMVGAFAAEAAELCNVHTRHNAYPWELVRDTETGKPRLDRGADAGSKSARLGYFIIFVLAGVVGAGAAVCAAAGGWISGPFLEIAVGFGAQQVLFGRPSVGRAARSK